MNLPTSFKDYMRVLLGDEEYEKLWSALQHEPPVSIRYNRDKCEKAGKILSGCDSSYEKVPWASAAYYLASRPSFTFDPLFHAGTYYVQEASSMFLEQVLKHYVDKPSVMLDVCAAPGGKSTHARSVLPSGSLLVANEVIKSRAYILAENLTKWGHPDVVITNSDPADFSALPSFFDIILADVPCSGEGMFRKDAGAIAEWSPENVEMCWQRQRRILSDIWPSLKPGGLFIYSTCTYNMKEDEENVRWIKEEFGASSLPIETKGTWNITGNLLEGDESTVYHFFPHRTRGEGFFLAILRKPETDAPSSYSPSKKKRSYVSAVSKEHLAKAGSWLNKKREDYEWLIDGNGISVFPRQYLKELAMLKQVLHVVQAGTAVGEVKGKDLIPAHALAMSSLLKEDAFFCEELSYEQAISFLRKEAIVLSSAVPKGYVLLAYKGVPIGFVKNIGNRANNLYPAEWRIRSSYLPEKPEE